MPPLCPLDLILPSAPIPVTIVKKFDARQRWGDRQQYILLNIGILYRADKRAE